MTVSTSSSCPRAIEQSNGPIVVEHLHAWDTVRLNDIRLARAMARLRKKTDDPSFITKMRMADCSIVSCDVCFPLLNINLAAGYDPS
jgi:hypothetical protein